MPQHSHLGTIRVAIHSTDPVIRAGLVAALQEDRHIRKVSPDEVREAHVVVVAVERFDCSAVDLLRGLSDAPHTPFLALLGQQWQADISEAVDCGIRAVLWRKEFSPAVFVQTLRTIANGGGSLPPSMQGALMQQVQRTQREVLAPRGLTASGVTPREANVLRLVADGLELGEIARKLSYSERTVKYVLYGLMKRMHLRNRPHAVSYAIRAGII